MMPHWMQVGAGVSPENFITYNQFYLNTACKDPLQEVQHMQETHLRGKVITQ